ncbi:MAG: GNAT family N-acetyltransferase [Candidatus Promineifilaceae bacterium]|jgi:ribosomal protein S18 acetylase RimI-like enzyme
MTNLTITIHSTAYPELRRQIHEAIKEFNNQHSPAHKEARLTGIDPLDIFVYEGKNQLVGALVADTYWGWLDIDDLWLHEYYRRQGLGTRLLETAEKEARRRGCRRAVVKTFSFQARGFYEKNGYRVTGRLDDYPPGESLYWMVKDILSLPSQISPV